MYNAAPKRKPKDFCMMLSQPTLHSLLLLHILSTTHSHSVPSHTLYFVSTAVSHIVTYSKILPLQDTVKHSWGSVTGSEEVRQQQNLNKDNNRGSFEEKLSELLSEHNCMMCPSHSSQLYSNNPPRTAVLSKGLSHD